MFKNYLKVAWRNIVRHKGYSFISIFGLTIGLACSIMILLWVEDEFSFDRFHKNIDRLYQVSTYVYQGNKPFSLPGAPPWIIPALKSEYPEEIAHAARMTLLDFDFPVRYRAKYFMEKVRLADSSLLELFTFPLLKGEYSSWRNNARSILLTEAMAEKYFGSEDPIGKALTLDNRYEFTVVGVLQNIPRQSTLCFDFLAPLEFTEEFLGKGYLGNWNSCRFLSYVQLAPGVSPADFSRKISRRILQSDPQAKMNLFLFPVASLHLYSVNSRDERIWTVRIFLLIALLIMIISSSNFINLTTAQGVKRAKEVGLRKVVGAQRMDLVRQFLGESLLLIIIALLLALILVKIMLPAFSSFTNKSLSLEFGANGIMLLKVLAIGLIVGLLAGGYPALVLSAYQPVKILGTSQGSRRGTASFRNVLVIGQFFISIALIICTMVISRQHHFLRSRDLGLNKEQILCLPLSDALRETADSFKNGMRSDSRQWQVTRTSSYPTGGDSTHDEGYQWEGKRPDFNPFIAFLNVDEGFLETFQIKMAAGSAFPKNIGPESNNVLINETFARMVSAEWPVGKRLFCYWDGGRTKKEYSIIGVVRDFHFRSLKWPVEPMIICCNWRKNSRFKYLFVKLPASNMAESIRRIGAIFKKFNPDSPFQYHFLDEDFENLYKNEQQLGQVFFFFALLAIFISSLGLFGLAVFITGQRTKEVGIRKALGASVAGIFLLLSRKFVWWVVLANIIAWPLAYLAMSRWLQNFAYRTSLEVGIFIIAAVLALLIALLTVSYQSLRAACANPVESLRYE